MHRNKAEEDNQWKNVDASTKENMLLTMRENNRKKRMQGLRAMMGTTTQIGFSNEGTVKREDNRTIELDSSWTRKKM